VVYPYLSLFYKNILKYIDKTLYLYLYLYTKNPKKAIPNQQLTHIKIKSPLQGLTF